METVSTSIGRYKITGYKSDYVFNTIQNTNNFYENTILNKWNRYFESAKTILDIGANLGNHTLYWAENTNYNVIYAFEPYQPNYELLEKNILDNKLENIILVNKAVGRKKSKVKLFNFDESNYGGTTFILDAENAEDIEGTVELISIDEFSVENEIKEIDFVKIDTEGFELDVLKGLVAGIENYTPDFWIEVSTNSFSTVIDFLEAFGYVLVDIEGFNLLFLHPHRHQNIVKYEYSAVLSNMFNYLEKTNLYYKNYETAKKWVTDKEKNIHLLKEKIVNLNETLKLSNQKYAEAIGNYKTAKKWVAEKEQYINLLKNDILKYQEKNRILQDLEKDYKEQLIIVNTDYDLIVTVLDEVNRKIHHLEVQNGYLKSENEQYRKKLAIITDSWWGKLGIKVYKKMKQIKAKLYK